MRTVLLTIGTLIAHSIEPLSIFAWVVVGVVGLSAVIGDLITTDINIKNRNSWNQ